MSDKELAAKLRAHGIVYPWRTIHAARKANIGIATACAVLQMETSGGHNVFGHDPTIFVGAGQVTKTKYLAYKAMRQGSNNRLMQGVGPMQLTYYTLQDKADAMGGCWRPRYNILVGLQYLKGLMRQYGLRGGIAHYNGSGPYDWYANTVLQYRKTWQGIIRG